MEIAVSKNFFYFLKIHTFYSLTTNNSISSAYVELETRNMVRKKCKVTILMKLTSQWRKYKSTHSSTLV